MIPSRDECLELLKKYGYYMQDRPITHALLVERTSLKISKMLIARGVKADITKIGVAALIHDIGKNPAEKQEDHALRGYNICKNEKMDDAICIIVKNHDIKGITRKLNTWEEKIVAYADKICDEKIVGLEERFSIWEKKYPQYDMKDAKAKSILLEKEILNKLDLSPRELYDVLR